jgi:UDP-N-acetylglucosamine--N-acetylmuramyl-(pentapeptide) pyrophosphoryl-undecaprenol N-acetylglucosamine transferase
MKTAPSIPIVIAAGGTGGHIFPALSVALQFKKDRGDVALLWIGTSRSREKELCAKHTIPIKLFNVTGIERKITLKTMKALLQCFAGFLQSSILFIKNRPAAVIAFGGYVCAPVLAAARLLSIPYFIHEQNTAVGLVNRVFATRCRKFFAGLPMVAGKKIRDYEMTGTPVRERERNYEQFAYPSGFDGAKMTILICGGSQGAQSMNECLREPVVRWAAKGYQIVWQTGTAGYRDIAAYTQSAANIFVFSTLDDLYPFYSVASLVIGRAGASTLAEVAYFGLPCVLIPLPWAADNHQWTNAGVVEEQGWGIRVKQDDQCHARVDASVMAIVTDKQRCETMKAQSLLHAPLNAAQTIVRKVMDAVAV